MKIPFNFIRKTLKQASYSDMRSKHGAIIVKNGDIVSYGHNKTLGSIKRTIYENRNERLSRHAEEDVLRNADQRMLKGAVLYVVRWGVHRENPTYMNSKPCDRCMSSIKFCKERYGLKDVYYSINTDANGNVIWGRL